jgi:hypothetical protein
MKMITVHQPGTGIQGNEKGTVSSRCFEFLIPECEFLPGMLLGQSFLSPLSAQEPVNHQLIRISRQDLTPAI